MNDNSSSATINRVFSQLGVRFVKDRTSCSLAACGTAVCHQTLGRRRLAPRRLVDTSQRRSDRKRRFCSGGAGTGLSEACAVCEDEASGCHYGAVTCDSCKMFFEQSVRDRHIYDCHFSRACDLRLQRRNHCQGCRWDKCLEIGMTVSAVSKTRAIGHETEADTHQHHRHRQWTRLDAEDMLRMADQYSNLAQTPRPSLPSPTDTESSVYDGFLDDEETVGRTTLSDSQPRQEPMPFGSGLLRDALIPLDSPESLAARLTDLERSCLASLFQWNKRRLEHRSDSLNGNFGAAAANWTPILLATGARQFLAGWQGLATYSSELLTVALVDRLKWLLRGREFEFEPLLDQFENLAKHIGNMCSQLMSTALETKRDVIRDIILLMGDYVGEELCANLQLPTDRQQQQQHHQLHRAAMLNALTCLTTGADQLKSAQPEQRALLLAALVTDMTAPVTGAERSDATTSRASGAEAAPRRVAANSPTATCLLPNEDDEHDDGATSVPILFGL